MAKSLTNQSVFTEGSIPLHVLRMSITGSIGLMGIFLVDLLDMYFLSLLGQSELAAAVGFAGSVTFFTTSCCVGLGIATGIMLSRLIGKKRFNEARSQLNGAIVYTLLFTVLLACCLYPFVDEMLILLGAKGITAIYAEDYLHIVLPSLPFLGLAMCFSATLRSIGAASASMATILVGGLINCILDPIFIFGLGLSVKGAALASAISAFCMCFIAFFLLIHKYQYFVKIHPGCIASGFKRLVPLATPAILADFAGPFGNAYVVSQMSNYGDGAVAGYSILCRVVPVAFAVIYSLTGAIGPILGQNIGAEKIDRIHQTLKYSYMFVVLYVIAFWILLNGASGWIVRVFHATGEAVDLIDLYCSYLCLSFMFIGIHFVANAFFNNLGKPIYSTALNWLKATIGTVPFVYLGGIYCGDDGLLLGQCLGHIVFGIIAYLWVKWYLMYTPEAINARLSSQ